MRKRTEITPELIERIRTMLAERRTLKIISQECHIGYYRLANLIKKLNLNPEKIRGHENLYEPSQERIEQFTRMFRREHLARKRRSDYREGNRVSERAPTKVCRPDKSKFHPIEG